MPWCCKLTAAPEISLSLSEATAPTCSASQRTSQNGGLDSGAVVVVTVVLATSPVTPLVDGAGVDGVVVAWVVVAELQAAAAIAMATRNRENRSIEGKVTGVLTCE
jgi:hypothetical protein